MTVKINGCAVHPKGGNLLAKFCFAKRFKLFSLWSRGSQQTASLPKGGNKNWLASLAFFIE
jgi:hypothetical protein